MALTKEQFTLLATPFKHYVDGRFADDHPTRLHYKFNYGAGSILLAQYLAEPVSKTMSPSQQKFHDAMEGALRQDGLTHEMLLPHYDKLYNADITRAYGVINDLQGPA